MSARTTKLRASIEPHLALFSAEFRGALDELLRLAYVGERAEAFVSSFGSAAPKATSKGPARTSSTQPKKPRSKKRAKVSSSKAGDAPTSASPNTALKGPSLRETVLEVLRAASKPMPLAEIEHGVKVRGHASKSGNFAKLLSLTIGRMKSELRRVDRGVYALSQ